MNLAERLRNQALEVEAEKNRTKLLNTINLIKQNAEKIAKEGKFELVVWLSDIRYAKLELPPILNELRKEGFTCILGTRDSSSKYPNYESQWGYYPTPEDVVIVSWR